MLVYRIKELSWLWFSFAINLDSISILILSTFLVNSFPKFPMTMHLVPYYSERLTQRDAKPYLTFGSKSHIILFRGHCIARKEPEIKILLVRSFCSCGSSHDPMKIIDKFNATRHPLSNTIVNLSTAKLYLITYVLIFSLNRFCFIIPWQLSWNDCTSCLVCRWYIRMTFTR